MCLALAPFTLGLCWTVFVLFFSLFLFTTHHFVSASSCLVHKMHTRFTLNVVVPLLRSSHSSVHLLLYVCSNVINVHRKFSVLFLCRLQTWLLFNFSDARVLLCRNFFYFVSLFFSTQKSDFDFVAFFSLLWWLWHNVPLNYMGTLVSQISHRMSIESTVFIRTTLIFFLCFLVLLFKNVKITLKPAEEEIVDVLNPMVLVLTQNFDKITKLNRFLYLNKIHL